MLFQEGHPSLQENVAAANNSLRVADNAQVAFGSGHGHVQASFIAQEADFAVAVAPHETQDDGFFLPALEAVDAA